MRPKVDTQLPNKR